MAKSKRIRRKLTSACFHDVVESELRIGMPGIVRSGVSNAKKALISMRAADGRLVLQVLVPSAVVSELTLSGIELHTALHALGFIRLNDRCGQG